VILNTFRVALNWIDTDSGLNATNVMHFRKASADAEDVANTIDGNVVAGMWGVTRQHAHVHTLEVTPLDGSGATFTFLTGDPAKWSGGDSPGDAIPQMAAIIKLVTSKRGRSYRGRVFIPWVTESNQTAGKIAGAAVTSLQSAWTTFVSDMDGDSCQLVIASYALATAEDVTAILAESFSGTQRRRLHRTST
jgi:hypothetical protein